MVLPGRSQARISLSRIAAMDSETYDGEDAQPWRQTLLAARQLQIQNFLIGPADLEIKAVRCSKRAWTPLECKCSQGGGR
jgi:hypothetical protein